MSHLPILRTALACLLLAFLAPCATARELSKEERRWAKDCLARLDAQTGSVRAGATQGLAALGTDAVPLLADVWWDAREEEDAARIEAVLEAIGRPAVVKRLRRMQDDARGAEAKMLDALISVLTDESAASGAAPPDTGTSDEREEQRWSKECIKRFKANSPRVRRGAERAMTALGLSAMPDLVDLWMKAKSRAERGAVKRVLTAMGRDEVVERLRLFREGARGHEAERLDELLAELGASIAPGSAGAYGLEASNDLDWREVPFGAEHEIRGRFPTALGLDASTARTEGVTLAVDTDGDRKPDVRLQPGESRQLEVRARGGARPVLFYRKLGSWYACSASLLAGNAGTAAKPVLLVLWDADLDGSFVGDRDYLKVGESGFYRHRKDGIVLHGDDRARYELVRDGGGLALRLEVLPRPRGLTKEAWEGLVALNRFRARLGLAPVGHDAKRSAACRKHAAYLALNVKRDRKDLGGTTHEENPGLPGYTKEGAQAGAHSNIGAGRDVARTIERLAGTMLHRARWLCARGVEVGIGTTRRSGGWSVIWTGQAVADGDAPVPVPAPGARGVPRGGAKEWPPPDRVPRAYEQRIGYPVSVTYRGLAYEDVALRLYMTDGTTEVPGAAFTPAQPISTRFPQNGGTAFYMPSAPLVLGTWYWAVFTAKRGGTPVRFAWTFLAD